MRPAQMFLSGTGGKPISSLATFNVKTQKAPIYIEALVIYIFKSPLGDLCQRHPFGRGLSELLSFNFTFLFC